MVRESFLWGLMLVAAPAIAHAKAQRCSIRVGELVPTAEVARGVAEAIIRARQTREKMASYVLHVERDERDANKWAVWQGLPQPQPSADGTILLQVGGGGMTMRIDRCTGEISKVHYLR